MLLLEYLTKGFIKDINLQDQKRVSSTDDRLNHHNEDSACTFFRRVSGPVTDRVLRFNGEENCRGEIVHVL